MAKKIERRSLLAKSVNAALVPFQVATSKPAQRAYLGTFFLFVASVLLFGVSAIAYVLFYYNYVPQIGVTRPIHLQFGNGNPHGTASLSTSLASQQPYDISLSLHLPRTSANLATGNFMIELVLLAPKSATASPVEHIQSALGPVNGSTAVLSRSRRPAIMTHRSMIVDTARIVANLPWLVFGWQQESEMIDISMFEGVEFAKGWKNIPNQVQAVIEADGKMQFYTIEVNIRAQLRGIRWIMYKYRTMSFIFFTATFFCVSMTSAFVVYLLFALFRTPYPSLKEEAPDKIKSEESESEKEKPMDPLSTADLSDTPRAFPTHGRQRPLQFSRPNEEVAVKEEEDEGRNGIQPVFGEADDEEEFEDDASSAWRDSGIGTGREDRDWRGTQRRRKSSHGR